MSEASLPYQEWIDRALRDVIKQALKHAAQHGFPGQHHFYITFRTGDEGVQVAPQLRAQHPNEMTIVLQHQYWDLFVDEQLFSVTLKFGGRPQRVTVPFDAMTAFADPAVNFALQFKSGPPAGGQAAASGDSEPSVAGDRAAGSAEAPPQPEETTKAESDDRASGEVITLDTFRKK